jgi:hypothetical protein
MYWYKTSSVILKVKTETVIGQGRGVQGKTNTIMGKAKIAFLKPDFRN